MTRYFTNYYTAKRLAEKRKLVECEYGDMFDHSGVSYCCWNKSGDRNDETDIECYYLFDGHRPEKKANPWLKDYVKSKLGIIIKRN